MKRAIIAVFLLLASCVTPKPIPEVCNNYREITGFTRSHQDEKDWPLETHIICVVKDVPLRSE